MSQKSLKPEDFNKVIIKETVRPNGSLRIQQDFSNCPTLTEQHTAHLTNLNWLIKKYTSDELAAYMAAREQYRQEILGHDFSQEPDLQGSMNVVVQLKKNFNELPDNIREKFRSPAEFYKFIDNPNNAQKMIDMGLLTKPQVDKLIDPKAGIKEESGSPDPVPAA